MSFSERIADFVANTNYNRIPQKAISIAKKAILDWIGVTIAGSKELGPKILSDQVRRTMATEESGVICGRFKTSAELSAWVNGTSGHCLDYDDTFPNQVGYNFHPTVPILPAVLSMGERINASGREILTAYIIGIEIEARLGEAIGLYSSRIGWHPTAIIGTIGASMACAHMLKLDFEKTQTAMGIACSLASGIIQNFGSMTKPLHAGNAARNGVVASLLAQSGFTASKNIMEGETGFCSIFSGGRSKGIEDEDDFGKRWHIISPGISLKPYPCCRSTHSSIDASLYLKEIIGIDHTKITKIICRTSPDHPKLARFHRPRNGTEGKFSIPYCIAVSLIRGRILLEDFTDEKVNDPEVQNLLTKVDFEYPEEYIKERMSLSQEVVVEIENKKRYSHKIEIPKGEPENPLTDHELRDKFIDCSRFSLSQMESEKVMEIVNGLESLDHISKLMNMVTFTNKGG